MGRLRARWAARNEPLPLDPEPEPDVPAEPDGEAGDGEPAGEPAPE